MSRVSRSRTSMAALGGAILGGGIGSMLSVLSEVDSEIAIGGIIAGIGLGLMLSAKWSGGE